MIRYTVDLDEVAHLFAKKLPREIVEKIFIWVIRVEMEGLIKTRKIQSLHDESLKGQRAGQRSIRLNRAYRLIYVEDQNSAMIIVKVIEVNKHDY